MTVVEAIIIAVVEGITEFLPISSTGHMIIASSFLGISEDNYTKLFEVAIQLGAIMAVVVLYYKKFFDFKRWQFYAKLIVGVIPALLLGFLFNDQIEALLQSTVTVAVSLLVGGIILLFIDNYFRKPTISEEKDLGYVKSFIIGCWQVLAMVPGVSRSASSIIGGMQQKLTRNLAAEFSFFLAVPTMFAAAAYSLFLKDWKEGGIEKKGYELITESPENIRSFIVGNMVAFIVALLAIRFFIKFLQLYGFRFFGAYRIIVGIILLVLIFLGYLEP
jgi:undecaprenyl-diphosphatase